VVFCCDEKSQIQALQRSQPGLPLGKGHIRTQTHDCYSNGTVTLFAALDYLVGKAQHNLNPKCYVWKAKGEEILAKIERAWKVALGEDKDVTII
jgi:hypothetical protein